MPEKTGDLALRAGPPGTMKPEDSGYPIPNVIQVFKTAKYSSEGIGLLRLLDGGTCKMQHRAIHVNGKFLKRRIERPKADAHAEFALREVLLKIPEQVGY